MFNISKKHWKNQFFQNFKFQSPDLKPDFGANDHSLSLFALTMPSGVPLTDGTEIEVDRMPQSVANSRKYDAMPPIEWNEYEEHDEEQPLSAIFGEHLGDSSDLIAEWGGGHPN